MVALVGDYKTIERIELDDLGIAWTIEAPVSGWDSALSGECEPVQAEHPDNVLARGFINKGDVESGFREADFVAEISCQTSAVEHCYIEPEAGHARRVGDRIELFVTTQTPFMDKTEVASVLGLDAEQIRVIPSAVPENPLGRYWIDLGEGYGIHGTNRPNSIGRAESRGCLRLHNANIERLYGMLVTGCEVVIHR